jgi:uncharacterized membrane protein YfcA
VYWATQGAEIAALWPILAVATAAVVIGTGIGIRLLPNLRIQTFRRTVAVLLAILGVAMLASALQAS